MKRFYFVFFSLWIPVILYAQSQVINVTPNILEVWLEPMETTSELITVTNTGLDTMNWSASINDLTGSYADDYLDLIIQQPLPDTAWERGVATDGNFIYTTTEFAAIVKKYDLSGNYLSSFIIPQIAGIWELTWDGFYFYGASGMSMVYVLDFENQQLVDIIDISQSIRNIAYNEDQDIFYGYNMAGKMLTFDHAGNQIDFVTLPADVPNLQGIVYDNFSDGNPYLWGYGYDNDNFNTLIQLSLPALQPTGVIVDMDEVLTGQTFNLPGGLFVSKDIVPGIWSLGGLVRNQWLWAVELSEYEYWISIDPATGTLAGGESQDISVTFDATQVLPWMYTAEIVFSTLPDVGTDTVYAQMEMEGPPFVDMLTAEVSCTDVILNWQIFPPGHPVDSFHIYRDNELLITTYNNYYDDTLLTPGDQHSYFSTAYFFNGWESYPTNTAEIEVPVPDSLDPANLSLNAPVDSIVYLSWENHACAEPDYYLVYRDLLLIDQVTEPFYYDTLPFPGTFQFYVSSEFYFGTGWSETVYYTWEPVSVSEENDPSFSVFPNPATEIVFIQHPELPETVTLYNAMGEKVLFVSNPKFNRFDVSSYERGIYFLVAAFKNTKQNTRLIIR